MCKIQLFFVYVENLLPFNSTSLIVKNIKNCQSENETIAVMVPNFLCFLQIKSKKFICITYNSYSPTATILPFGHSSFSNIFILFSSLTTRNLSNNTYDVTKCHNVFWKLDLGVPMLMFFLLSLTSLFRVEIEDMGVVLVSIYLDVGLDDGWLGFQDLGGWRRR